MKRGKDDENIMGPMFPRLHVNDKEKGGPRAPPRNKMALYEHLSIPSQRFNSGVLPLNPSNTSNLVPRGSSSQFVGGNLSASSQELEQRTNLGDEDDFRVPVFVHSGMGQHHSETQNDTDREKLLPFSTSHSGRSLKIQNVVDNDPKHIGSTGINLRQNVRNQSEENQDACVSSSDHSVRSSRNFPTREKIAKHEEKANASPNQQYRDNPVANFSSLCENDASLHQEPTNRLQPNDSGHSDGVPEMKREIEKGSIPRPGCEYRSAKDCNSPNEPDIDSECRGQTTCVSPQLENRDKSNDISETSMVDSISALDISPDDVVGIIGQKHFWKARRVIVNQQRVFAVQVFELHRLIKVQRLIAGSPHLLLEDSTYLGKPSIKGSPSENLPSECVVTPPIPATKRNDDFEKPNHEMEGSAENAVGKTSLSSVKNGSQPSNYGPYSGNPTTVPMPTDTKIAPWCFHQSLGHQWLVPVMSPSEGLVYKPYTAPGFMGSVCGGCGPFGPIPLAANFVNLAYGVSASHHHQGMVLPGAPPVGHGYFPPYGMPVMNPANSGSTVEQMTCFTGSGSHGQTGHLSKCGANFNMQHQSLCNVPTQKSGSVSQVKKFQASKGAELQVSTGSSPSERAQGVGTARTAEGRDPLPLFPMAPAAPEGAPQPQETDQPTRVIKVVPHNPRSATESAARIFQSIQQERKQNNSI